MNLLQELINQLENLNIAYTWDPDWEEQGVLIICSDEKANRYLSIGLIFHKESGQLKDMDFSEVNTDAVSYTHLTLPTILRV